jgi:hypothetical protein
MKIGLLRGLPIARRLEIYSQYFWGFPLKLFDFIGISEFATTEIQRFSIEILGCVEQKMILNDSAKRHEAASSIDPKLRKHIERCHSEDMALYRHALQIRDRQLEKLGILKGEVL